MWRVFMHSKSHLDMIHTVQMIHMFIEKKQTPVTFIGDDEIGLICDQKDPYRFSFKKVFHGISVNVVYIHTLYLHTYICTPHLKSKRVSSMQPRFPVSFEEQF